MANDKYFNYIGGEIKARTNSGVRSIVSGVSFDLEKGESLALLGRTGSGKTMTSLSIMGLLPENVFQENAEITLDGKSLPDKKLLGTEIVCIPQNGLEFLNHSLTVRSQMSDSIRKLGIRGKKEIESYALERLALAGFDKPEEILDKYPFELSGGMAQRVCIALAACSNAKLLIADEPTNGLDEENRKAFADTLEKVFPDACKIIITHDNRVAELCDKEVCI